MIRLILFVLYIAMLHSEEESFEKSLRAAKDFAKVHNKKITDFGNEISVEDLKSQSDKGKTFDAKEARNRAKTKQIPLDATTEFLLSAEVLKNSDWGKTFNSEEYFLKRGDEILEDPDKFTNFVVNEETNYDYEKCQEIDSPFFVSYQQQLQVTVNLQPEVKKSVKICSGHEDSKKHTLDRLAQKHKDKLEKIFSQDPTVKSSEAWISEGGIIKDYKLKWKWIHLDDSDICNHFSIEERVIKKECLVEEDSWEKINYEPLTESPQCTYIGKECLEKSPRNINGKNIERQCWLEKLNFICRNDNPMTCNFLKNRQCIFVNKKCILDGINGCAIWEKTYKCITQNKKNFSPIQANGLKGLDQENWNTQYGSNTSFNQMTTTLSIFEALKNDLENSAAYDASQVQIFKGNKNQCSKSVADNIMYDCCFSYSGLTNDLKLSKCTADEIALANMRERGLCHYIGKYDEKFLNAWKSHTEHVYCCFPNKLARIFHEQAREQLGIDWGTAKHPNCRGFTSDELALIDFSKLDLSEAIEISIENSELSNAEEEMKKKEKLDLIENSIRNRISEINGT